MAAHGFFTHTFYELSLGRDLVGQMTFVGAAFELKGLVQHRIV